LSDLAERGILTEDVTQPDGVLDALDLLPVTWTFQFLQVVSILVALISAAGLLLFLAARQQRQQVSYVLMRRMGMTRRSYLGSLLLELSVLTGWAWLTGALTGTGALLTATHNIDVNRGFLPPTLLRLPAATLIGTGLGLACVAAALAWWTQRHAERIDPAAVLRT
jgi:predicted lysophospholipase L1 biosynthesis ABC-type transport system permease subunit